MLPNNRLNARKKATRASNTAAKRNAILQKAQLIINHKTKEIIANAFGNGSQHDLQLFKTSKSALSAHMRSLADAAYQGLADLHSNSRMSAKKSKLHPLTKEQKASNRKLTCERILVENVIRRLKIFRILSERYRRKCFSLRFNLSAAIHNLELCLKN